MHQQNNKEM